MAAQGLATISEELELHRFIDRVANHPGVIRGLGIDDKDPGVAVRLADHFFESLLRVRFKNWRPNLAHSFVRRFGLADGLVKSNGCTNALKEVQKARHKLWI